MISTRMLKIYDKSTDYPLKLTIKNHQTLPS